MNPVAFGRDSFSLGLGDRLGLASPGHLHCLPGTKIRPVLAQQSIRELVLTGRTYEEVLDAASWAVFQEGYHTGLRCGRRSSEEAGRSKNGAGSWLFHDYAGLLGKKSIRRYPP